MKSTTFLALALAGFASLTCLTSTALVACDDSSTVHETVDSGSGSTDSGIGADTGTTADGAPIDDCVKNPTTYEEIINACTDAAKVDKHPVLPNLLPDGGLPPLK